MTKGMSDEMKCRSLPFKMVLCREMFIEVVDSARGFLVSDTGLFGCTCEPSAQGERAV